MAIVGTYEYPAGTVVVRDDCIVRDPERQAQIKKNVSRIIWDAAVRKELEKEEAK